MDACPGGDGLQIPAQGGLPIGKSALQLQKRKILNGGPVEASRHFDAFAVGETRRHVARVGDGRTFR